MFSLFKNYEKAQKAATIKKQAYNAASFTQTTMLNTKGSWAEASAKRAARRARTGK